MRSSTVSAPSDKWIPQKADSNWAALLSDRKYWSLYFLVTVAITVAGVGYYGGVAVSEVPPVCDFVTETGEVVFSADMITHGEEVFHLRGLMSYGSFLGDGSERGPDYTAEALHLTAASMVKHYQSQLGHGASQFELKATEVRVRADLRSNTYDEKKHVVVLNDAQVTAWKEVAGFYKKYFQGAQLHRIEQIRNSKDVEDLAAFFFWGGWLCAAQRPGEEYSYTHNWPYDPLAGNYPTTAVVLWSLISIMVLFIGISITFFIYGQFKDEVEEEEDERDWQPLTTQDLESKVVRPTQRACYKFFVLSMIGFVIQTFAGIACSIDFVRPWGFSLCSVIPFTVFRSYHTTFQIFWFFVGWVGTTIFFLPRFYKQEPVGQSALIELLFAGCAVVAAGGTFGIPLGQTGYLQGGMAYFFGSQGWEFLELGRIWQDLLLAGFCLWVLILFRGVQPYLTWKTVWSTPAWLFYGSSVMVGFLFFSSKMTPKSNFIIADFWRWMVVHMWVEVTFEVFTTVVVAYLYREMGIISRAKAERATYIAVMLFFLTAVIGVGHNFYWIAKPTGVIAFGSVFSTTQVFPLILLTLDAWKHMQMTELAEEGIGKGKQQNVMGEVWLFLLGVNFWNVAGAGLLGSLVNLPIINYYNHATYLTGNHAHGAMFGVKGNIALGSILFSVQHLVDKEHWSPGLVRMSFWCLQGGIGLMMFLSMFPLGMYQFYTAIKYGLWYARSSALIQGEVFQTLAKARSVGGHFFGWGGLLPLAYFVISRWFYLRPVTPIKGDEEHTSSWLTDKVHAE